MVESAGWHIDFDKETLSRNIGFHFLQNNWTELLGLRMNILLLKVRNSPSTTLHHKRPPVTL